MVFLLGKFLGSHKREDFSFTQHYEYEENNFFNGNRNTSNSKLKNFDVNLNEEYDRDADELVTSLALFNSTNPLGFSIHSCHEKLLLEMIEKVKGKFNGRVVHSLVSSKLFWTYFINTFCMQEFTFKSYENCNQFIDELNRDALLHQLYQLCNYALIIEKYLTEFSIDFSKTPTRLVELSINIFEKIKENADVENVSYTELIKSSIESSAKFFTSSKEKFDLNNNRENSFKHIELESSLNDFTDVETCIFGETTPDAKFDIAEILTKPTPFDIESHMKPSSLLTNGFQCLIDNLEKVKYMTYDHFSATEEEALINGLAVNYSNFACFSASYIGLGFFEPSSFFEYPFQGFYEIEDFKEEFEEMFKDDGFFEDWKAKMGSFASDEIFESLEIHQQEALIKHNQKWSPELVRKSCWDQDSEPQKSDNDIIKKFVAKLVSSGCNTEMQTQETSSRNDATTKTDSNKRQTNGTSVCGVTASQSSRHWTVAPKLIISGKKASSSNSNNCIIGSFTDKNEPSAIIKGWGKNLYPIGTKPASMFSVANSKLASERASRNRSDSSCQPLNKFEEHIVQESTKYDIWCNKNNLNEHKRNPFSYENSDKVTAVNPFMCYSLSLLKSTLTKRREFTPKLASYSNTLIAHLSYKVSQSSQSFQKIDNSSYDNYEAGNKSYRNHHSSRYISNSKRVYSNYDYQYSTQTTEYQNYQNQNHRKYHNQRNYVHNNYNYNSNNNFNENSFDDNSEFYEDDYDYNNQQNSKHPHNHSHYHQRHKTVISNPYKLNNIHKNTKKYR